MDIMWNIQVFHSLDVREPRTLRQVAFQLIQYVRLPPGHHLDRPVAQVPREPGQSQHFCLSPHRPTKSDPLHTAAHDPAPGHHHGRGPCGGPAGCRRRHTMAYTVTMTASAGTR